MNTSSTALTLPFSELKRTIQGGSKTFWLASFFLPQTLKKAAFQVYTWCRFCDDAVDEAAHREQAYAHLKEITEQTQKVLSAYSPSLESLPPYTDLGEAFQRFQIPTHYAFELLTGLEWDLEGREYQTLAQLEMYCYHVAGTVGLMMAHILGASQPAALEHACDLGKAMQLTNIARDIREDEQRGRIYLPFNWRQELQINSGSLLEERNLSKTFQLVQRLLLRAEELYASGEKGILLLPPESAFAIRTAATFYREIGRKILRGGESALKTRSIISLPKKIQLLFLILWRTFK